VARGAAIAAGAIYVLPAAQSGASEIAKALRIGRASVYRVLGEGGRRQTVPNRVAGAAGAFSRSTSSDA
jgi:DNA invertase Pin-like site-specific DNA recombinase